MADRRDTDPVDRAPPHSEEAERGVLGSALTDPERVIDLCIEKQLIPQSFYNPRHRILYEHITTMHQNLTVVDLVTLSERLKTHDQLDELGGSALLRELVDSTPTSAHAEHYANIVFEKALLRRIIDTNRESIEKCYEPDRSAELTVAEIEQEIFSISEGRQDKTPPWQTLMKQTVKEINSLLDNRRGFTGIPSGFTDLDHILMGLQRKDMIILAARPSMGKTSLALNIVENVASGQFHPEKQAMPVAVFSVEMGAEQLVKRMLCAKAKVSYPELVQGRAGPNRYEDIMQAAEALNDLPIHIDDTAGLEATELRSRARRMKRQFDIQLIVVDYLQLMNCSAFAHDGRQRETAAISNHLKAMGKELNVPVIVLSQLSRAPETRGGNAVPKLSDLRDSGSIEQDADVVMLLRRPCKYPEDPEAHDTTLAIVDIAKHRNGAVGQIRMNFIDKHTQFTDRDERHHDAAYGENSE